MHVDDPEGPRFEMALDLLRESGWMSFRDLYISTREGRLDVRLESSWAPDQTDQERAVRDITRARQNIHALRQTSPRFASLTHGLPQRFALFYGYGMGEVEICEDIDGEIHWLWSNSTR
jgi:hypothetical protein